mgnify:CR=1 FL=1
MGRSTNHNSFVKDETLGLDLLCHRTHSRTHSQSLSRDHTALLLLLLLLLTLIAGQQGKGGEREEKEHDITEEESVPDDLRTKKASMQRIIDLVEYHILEFQQLAAVPNSDDGEFTFSPFDSYSFVHTVIICRHRVRWYWNGECR